MSTNDSDLTSLKVYERESAIRFEYIEKRLDEGSAKFKKLENMIWAVYPFILASIVFAKFV